MNRLHKPLVRTAAVLIMTAAFTTAGLGAAAAHVEVDAESTAAGTHSTLTFTVPGGSDTALTTRLKVDLPRDTPFSAVRVKPVEGWAVEVTEGKLPKPVQVNGGTVTRAPLSVTWTAYENAHRIRADQFQTFSILVGELPPAGSTVVLPVAQYYTDGKVRHWDQAPSDEAPNPENPAPSFVTASALPAQHTGTVEERQGVEASGPSSTPRSTGTLEWLALASGMLGLVAGTLALLMVHAMRRNPAE